eukprot:CAMPEP_0174230722 /NCGR_PEP_ID=MMETSP0417-20130205/1420_1 /TAXON_ID=242541 /ORGANISM="Mayorella sp, Strain BSH-02190019" /LENGTH=1024 /DNA_ID=CAMNT_0015308471 /DNA_START=162 /DNA_END=3236 /DNA_ORIENTATION=+
MASPQAQGDSLKEGWLNKQGGSIKTWKRRYFVLRRDTVLYYRQALNQKRIIKGTQPMGEIRFNIITGVEEALGKNKKHHFFFKINVNTERDHYLIVAPTAEIMHEWIEAINDAVRVYQETGGMPNTRASTTSLPIPSEAHSTSSSGGKGKEPESSEFESDEDDLEVEALIDEDLEFNLDDDDEINQAKDRSEQLYRAVSSGKFPMVKALLGMQLNRNWQNHRDGFQCALHVVAETNDLASAQLLLQENTKALRIQDSAGWTPLHTAAFFGHTALVVAFVEAGANVEARDHEDRTPAYLAVLSGHASTAIELVTASMRSADSHWHKLHLAVLRADTDEIEQILNNPKGTALHLGDFGTTPLHLCACVGAVNSLADSCEDGDLSASVSGAAPPRRAALDAANCARVLLSKQGQEFFHVDSLDNGNKTPLDFAASAGNVAVAKVLLEHGAPVSLRDNRNKTALHFAAGRGHKEMVELLLENDAALDVVDENGFTALHTAAVHGHSECVKLLINAGANVSLAGSKRRLTALFLAAHAGSVESIRALASAGASVNDCDSVGMSPLMEASSRGRYPCVSLLLELGAKVNAETNGRQTALHLATINCHPRITLLLLEHGADVNATDVSGTTALGLATKTNHQDLVKIILDHGGKQDVVMNGTTPLHEAVQNNSLSLVRTVLGRDGTVDLLNKDDATPLLLAAAVGNPNIVEFLIEQGANVNHVAQRGDHAILQAAKAGHPHIVELLIGKKVDLNHTDEEGRTALHYAVAAGHVEIVRILLDNGAEPNVVDKHQCTPAHVAAQCSQQACLLLLIGKGAKLSEQSGDLLQKLMSSLQAETAAAAPAASAAAAPLPPPAAARLPQPIAAADAIPSEEALKAAAQKPSAPLPPPLVARVPAASVASVDADDTPKQPAPTAPTSETGVAASVLPPGLPEPKVAERKPAALSAKPYIQEAQRLLSPDEYREFQGLLREYKAKELPIQALMTKMCSLFATEERTDLLHRFVQFIPARYRNEYRAMVAEYEASTATSSS